MKNILTLRLSEEIREELIKTSKKEKLPVSQIIRESISRYLSVKKYRRLRKKVLPFAESQGLLTDEDVISALKK